MLPATPPPMSAASQPGTPGGVIVVLVPPNGQSILPRLSPDSPRQPLPIPPQPQQRAPGSVPGGPVRASIYMTNRPTAALLESASATGQSVMILKDSDDGSEYPAEP